MKAGKKAWAKLSPAKKAKVLARLKRVRPKATGGGKSKSLAKGGGGGGSSPATGSTNKKPRGGATYQAVKVTGQAAVPLTDYALGKGSKSVDGLIAHARDRADLELGKGYATAAVDFAASKHRLVGHAGALSRLSITAIAPEAYLALKTFEDAQEGLDARTMHRNLAKTTMGYNPGSAKGSRFDWKHERFRTYHGLKWIGAGVRLIANRTRIGRAIIRPIRENVLKELGGAV